MAACSNIGSERPEIRSRRVPDGFDGRKGEMMILKIRFSEQDDIDRGNILLDCIWKHLYDGVAKTIDILEAANSICTILHSLG